MFLVKRVVTVVTDVPLSRACYRISDTKRAMGGGGAQPTGSNCGSAVRAGTTSFTGDYAWFTRDASPTRTQT